MQIEPIDRSRLDEVREFTDRYIRPNYICVREPFFDWQYLQSAELIGDDVAPSPILVASDGKVQGVSLAIRSRFRAFGQSVIGTWHTDWFADSEKLGAGLLLIQEQLRRNPLLCTAGQSLIAANVFGRLRPMIWFELERLFAVCDAKQTASLLYAEDQSEPRTPRYQLDYLKAQSIAKPSPQVVVESIQEFDRDYDAHWSGLVGSFLVATDRTSAYMNWRYVRHPMFHYERVRCRTSNGAAYFIWREEPVSDTDLRVARICDVLGSPAAITSSFPAVFAELKSRGLAMADFSCSHAVTCQALLAAGMRPAITLPDFDLPRLFSPRYNDVRKRLNFAYSAAPSLVDSSFFAHQEMYFSKGDTNQDRPNPR